MSFDCLDWRKFFFIFMFTKPTNLKKVIKEPLLVSRNKSALNKQDHSARTVLFMSIILQVL